jgi:cytochrome c553
MKRVMAMAAAIGMFAASTAFAEEKAAAKIDLEKGKATAAACVGCHGPEGNSVVPTFPVLAGQHGAYITSQLKQFKANERKNPIMLGISATLSPEDMANVGAYFAEQKPNGNKASDEKLVAAGQKLYHGGNQATGVSACAACHSPSGAGIPAQFPRLAGQHPAYILAQLKAFKSGERANDPGKMMQGTVARMTDQEMAAVAEYVATLK